MTEHKHYKTLSRARSRRTGRKSAYIDKDEYEKLYAKSVKNPDKFWAKQGKRLDWIKPFSLVKNASFAYPDVSIKWFEDGTLNVSANCIDRHLKKRGKQTAIILGARRSRARSEAHHLSRAAQGRLPLRQRAEGARRQARRPRHDLSADDPGSCVRHARLRADRRDPFRRVRRLLAGLARRPHRGLQIDAS